MVIALVPLVSCHNLDGRPGPQHANEQRLFVADAPGGTGKTFVASVIQWYISSRVL